MTTRWQMLAGYNACANERVYENAAKLSDVDYRADLGAFFKSVHGTLNHLLATDRIWMRRFTGEGEAPTRLDAIFFESFEDLRAARADEDARIIAFIGGLDGVRLSSKLSYRAISQPVQFEQELAPALAHFFNHQTHHRGQLHYLLTGLVGAAPELDLPIYQRVHSLGGTRQVA